MSRREYRLAIAILVNTDLVIVAIDVMVITMVDTMVITK
jgi:hypothetical protein